MNVYFPDPQQQERDMLMTYLQRQRELVLWKCDRLAEDAARSVATPSGMTIKGIVQHLENVERSWFRDDVAGEAGLRFEWDDEDNNGAFQVAEGVTLAQLCTRYREETQRCDAAIASLPLDHLKEGQVETLRWVLHHMIEETARHVGHLDLLCELADGRVGEDPM